MVQEFQIGGTGGRRMERAVLVYTTFPGLVEAERVGKELVERRLAACANILPGMVSHYRWEGKVERAEEVVMLVKTRATLVEEVSAAIRELHSYEVPALVVIPLESVERNYLGWLLDATGPEQG
jgi:periplasmic divalent cation tolerance protein